MYAPYSNRVIFYCVSSIYLCYVSYFIVAMSGYILSLGSHFSSVVIATVMLNEDKQRIYLIG